MKLIYATSISYPSSRANRIHVLAMAKEFKKLLGGDFYFGGNDIKGLGIEYGNIINFHQTKSYILAFKYLKFVNDHDIDYIYCREDKLMFFVMLYNKLFFHLNLKYYYEAHDIPQKRKLFIKTLNRCDGIVVITDALKKELSSILTGGKRIMCTPDAVDLSMFNEKNQTSREVLGLPLNKKIVLYTGHLYEWKGAHTLAESAKYFDNDIFFVFVGGIPADVTIFNGKYGHNKNILILGQKNHSEIPSYLQMADVLVLPNSGKEDISRLYTSPMKMFEYMASGKPIIASDLPSIREILNEENSVLFTPDNSESLAVAIKKALNNQELSKKISEKALIDVKNYTWDKRAEDVLSFMISTKKIVKDKDFYNKESGQYSERRYPKLATSYVQFFFKKRLGIVINILRLFTQNKKNLNLLEIGCADGVVLREISKEMQNKFIGMTGIDTSEEMIKTAKELNSSAGTNFYVRGEESVNKKFDVILEVGVANYTNFDNELLYIKERLNKGGVSILSIAGNDSINRHFGGGKGFNNFLSYEEYEEKIENLFTIESISYVGFHIPIVWTIPIFARIIQPILEFLLRNLVPNLFHEKVYILSLKS